MTRGLVDEDEDAESAPTDRNFWEAKGSRDTLAMVDQALEIARSINASLELKYNKFYIGLARNGQPFNFITFRPRKGHLQLGLNLKQADEIDAKLEEAGLDSLEYSKRWSTYRIRLGKGDVKKHADTLRYLMGLAYDYRSA